MPGHWNSCDARSVPQQWLAKWTHQHGPNRFYLHLLLPHPRQVSIHVMQEAPSATPELSREYETGIGARTGSRSMDRSFSRSHHRRISHHLSTWRVHLLYRVRCEKRSSSEFN